MQVKAFCVYAQESKGKRGGEEAREKGKGKGGRVSTMDQMMMFKKRVRVLEYYTSVFHRC